jgi:hypothetical protein
VTSTKPPKAPATPRGRAQKPAPAPSDEGGFEVFSHVDE